MRANKVRLIVDEDQTLGEALAGLAEVIKNSDLMVLAMRKLLIQKGVATEQEIDAARIDIENEFCDALKLVQEEPDA